MHTLKLVATFAVLFLFALAGPAGAQNTLGSVVGTVTDPSGAGIANARLTLTDLGTNQTQTVSSSANGNYEFSLVNPARYRLEAEAAGFKRYVRSELVVNVSQRLALPVTLELGAVNESVTISSATPLLEAESSTLGGVITTQQVLDLPLNSRQVFSLASLTAGVTPSSLGVGDAFNTSVNFSVAGSQREQTKILMDGLDATLNVNNPSLQGVSSLPSVDAVQEFRVQASMFSAEYGRAAGGLLNVVLRSGSNQYHGSAYEYLRNSVMDANDFFANRSGVPLASFKRNQYGGTLGGPIRLPKIYNGADRTFFFFSYEALRARSASNTSLRVPTLLERQGDFTQSRTANGQPIVIYDPASTRRQADGTFVRDALAGNRIPANRIDPVTQGLLQYMPLPNSPGSGPALAGNFTASGSSILDLDRIDTKVDQMIGKGRLSVKYSAYSRFDAGANFYRNIAGGVANQDMRGRNAGVSYNNALSATTLLDAGIGYARVENPRYDVSQPFQVTSLHMPAYIDQIATHPVFPNFGIAGYATLGGAAGTPLANFADLYQSRASVSLVRGKQSIKIGGEYQQRRVNHSQNGNTGTYNFTRAFTQGPNALAATNVGGDAFASFLFGVLNGGSIDVVPYISTLSHNLGAYIQDDYRVSRTFTLNLGIRYDLEIPRTERYNRQNYWDLATPNPLAGGAYKGGLQFVGVNGNPRSPFDTDWSNVSPRFGFAWNLTPKSVLRGGYGIFFGISPVGAAGVGGGNVTGFSNTTSIVASNDGATPIATLSNPFPNGIIPATGSSLGLLTQAGQSVTSVLRNYRSPYMQQFNLGLQRTLPGNILVEATYAGSRGVHLQLNAFNLDQLPDQYLTLGNALLDQVNNPFFGQIAVGTLATRTVQRQQLLRPYPQFTGGGVVLSKLPVGNSTYHSLQLRSEKRFSQGVSFLAVFTRSKLLTDADAAEAFLGPLAPFQNYNNFRAERSLGSMDAPNRFVLSITAELPYGRNKRFGGSSPALVNALLGGWQVNAIETVQSGFPLFISAPNTVQAVGAGTQRPDSTGRSARLPDDRSKDAKIAEAFDITAFTQPAPFRFGNLARTVPGLRTGGIRNLDLSIFKNWSIRERARLQLRGEFFNALNYAQMDRPNSSFNTAAFGVITAQASTPRQIQVSLRLNF